MNLRTHGFWLLDCQIFPDRNVIAGPHGEQHIEPKAMRVLLLLAEQPTVVISRQLLLDSVWSETYSGEEALTRAISLLRASLGENRAERRFIETVPKSGYRLIVPVILSSTTAAPISSKIRPLQAIFTSLNSALIVAAAAISLIGYLNWNGGSDNSEPSSVRVSTPEQQAINQPLATVVAPQNSPVIRFSVPLGDDADLYLGGVSGTLQGRPRATSLAMSSDGNLLFYAAWKEGPDGRSSSLYSRRLDQERAEPIAGTEGAEYPFLSPDDVWIGFVAEGSLRRVLVSGGSVETVVDVEVTGSSSTGQTSLLHGRGGMTWGDDGTIVYGGAKGLYQVAASGGDGELIANLNSSMGQFRQYNQPHLLPGSEVLLFHGTSSTSDPKLAQIIAMNLDTRVQTSLLTNAMNPHYVAETGHLLFMRQGSLMAVRFDPEQLLIEGTPVLVQEDVMQAVAMTKSDYESGAAQLAVSSAGHLAYVRGGVYPNQSGTLMRVTLEGEADPINSASFTNLAFSAQVLSPEGDRLAFTDAQGRSSKIYVHDFVLDNTQLLNTGGFMSLQQVWSPDGRSIAFSSNFQGAELNIYRTPVDGSGEQFERLVPSDQSQSMMSWSSDGVIAYLQGGDIWMLPPDGERAPFFTSESLTEEYATFSPDGKWLAYAARSPRGEEVYIRPYPGPGPAVLISGNGSNAPAWSRDGTQLYFLQNNASLQRFVMRVVDITEGRPSPAQTLIDPWPYSVTRPRRSFDVLEEGGFITSRTERNGRDRFDELQVVLNFFEVLRQRVPD